MYLQDWRRVPTLIEGISLTWNIHTGEGTRHPVLDITITVQAVINDERGKEIFEIIRRLVNRWFTEKFAHILPTELQLPRDEGARVVDHRLDEMKPGLVRFSPTVAQTAEYLDKKYDYYWSWFRTGGRTEHDEGTRNQWEDIPTVTTWATSRRGRPPTGVEV